MNRKTMYEAAGVASYRSDVECRTCSPYDGQKLHSCLQLGKKVVKGAKSATSYLLVVSGAPCGVAL